MGVFSDLDIFINEVCEGDKDLIDSVTRELANHFNDKLMYESLSELAKRACDGFCEYMSIGTRNHGS